MPQAEPTEGKQVVALDWDGVLRPGFLVIDWATHLANQAAFPLDSLRLMQNQLHEYYDRSLSYADIASTIPELYAQGLAGLPVDEHLSMAAEYAASNEFRSSLTALADHLLRFINENANIHAVIISGGPESVLCAFGASAGINAVWAVRAEARGNSFTGLILDNPAIMKRKRELITNYLLSGRILLAAGDSESDQPMLAAAHHRIAIGDELASMWQGQPNTLTLPKGDLGQEYDANIESFLHTLQKDIPG